MWAHRQLYLRGRTHYVEVRAARPAAWSDPPSIPETWRGSDVAGLCSRCPPDAFTQRCESISSLSLASKNFSLDRTQEGRGRVRGITVRVGVALQIDCHISLLRIKGFRKPKSPHIRRRERLFDALGGCRSQERARQAVVFKAHTPLGPRWPEPDFTFSQTAKGPARPNRTGPPSGLAPC